MILKTLDIDQVSGDLGKMLGPEVGVAGPKALEWTREDQSPLRDQGSLSPSQQFCLEVFVFCFHFFCLFVYQKKALLLLLFAFIRVKHQMTPMKIVDRRIVFLNSAPSTSINYLFCSFISRPSNMQNLSRFKFL